MKTIQQDNPVLDSPVKPHNFRIGVNHHDFMEAHDAAHELSALLDVMYDRLKEEQVNDDTLCLASLAQKTSLSICNILYESAENLDHKNQDKKDEQTR